MGAGYINEETPETKAILYRVEEILRSMPVGRTPWEVESTAREIVRVCGVYREHRVEL